MSLQKSTDSLPGTAPAPRRKPKADLYTALLVIAFIAVLVAILFLYLELSFYDFKTKPGMTSNMAVSSQMVARVLPQTVGDVSLGFDAVSTCYRSSFI